MHVSGDACVCGASIRKLCYPICRISSSQSCILLDNNVTPGLSADARRLVAFVIQKAYQSRRHLSYNWTKTGQTRSISHVIRQALRACRAGELHQSYSKTLFRRCLMDSQHHRENIPTVTQCGVSIHDPFPMGAENMLSAARGRSPRGSKESELMQDPTFPIAP